jgi:hypothetical protein
MAEMSLSYSVISEIEALASGSELRSGRPRDGSSSCAGNLGSPPVAGTDQKLARLPASLTACTMGNRDCTNDGDRRGGAAEAGAGAVAGTEMMRSPRSWVTAGLAPEALDTLAAGLPASRLWSLLLEVIEARTAARRPAALAEQWASDRFVQPSPVDQRSLLDIDRHLLDAASAFDAIELSPVAPLGVCSLMARTSQNRVLSALRGTEVVSDPTNVMALECARVLRRDPAAVVRLATSHRCVRAQEFPRRRGLTANFRIFCLVSAGLERQNHAFVVDALAEHILVMASALDRLERHGFAFPDRHLTVLASAERTALADRIVAAAGESWAGRGLLEHAYYDGLRFQIAARSNEGIEIPLVDGGTFDWVAKLTSNRRAIYVASGLGSQLVATLFRRLSGARGQAAG